MAVEMSMILDDDDGSFTASDPKFSSNKLLCPSCDFDYIHADKAQVVKGEDNYKAWHGRGDLIVIDAWCENGHQFQICFGFHKGQTYAYIDNIKETPSHKLSECVELSACKLSHAI